MIGTYLNQGSDGVLFNCLEMLPLWRMAARLDPVCARKKARPTLRSPQPGTQEPKNLGTQETRICASRKESLGLVSEIVAMLKPCRGYKSIIQAHQRLILPAPKHQDESKSHLIAYDRRGTSS